MDSNDVPHDSQRENYLTVLLCLVIGIPLFVFFNLITGGLFILLILLAGCIGLLAAVHYFLWGRSFDREIAGEREEAELRTSMEDWIDDDLGRYRGL
ncbi:MAG TPA: hypothetical protein VK395_23140 [Gemmataceae bacterium]|nr:hypothetical protein [Gemmataceae bacterium]